MNKVSHGRRRWLSLGGAVLGMSLLPNHLLALVSTSRPRMLSFRNINTGDKLTAEFRVGRGFSSTVLEKMNHLMRDRRNNQVYKMDPKLFTKFYAIQNALGLHTVEIQVISGYRSPVSNAAMRRQSHGIARNSYHMRGQAVDFRINGVALSKVKQVAEHLNNGGVGYYPHSNFVHIDTGPVRTWRGS